MPRRRLLSLALACALSAPAAAQPDAENQEVHRPAVVDPQDLPVKHKSYFVPFAQIMIGNLTVSVTVQLLGVDWGQASFATMERNLTTPWELDDDAFSTNQLGHPFNGALSFSVARSTGHNFWVSGLFSFGSSMLWEVLLENEIPSINDQITTPFGGMFIGEAVHRFSRALLYRPYGKPSFSRRLAAAILDPVGAINRSWWGDPWAKTVPPSLNAHFGIGFQQPATLLDANRGGGGQLHVEAYVEHGLTGDRAFQPRHPLDHFELYTALNIGNDNLEGHLYVRGMLLGSGLWGEQLRGMVGLFGAYDYNNNDYVRASMLGVGPGGTAELRLGERGYLAGTLAAYMVPYGAAGGMNEEEGARLKDHHDGPGLAQVAELKLGERGVYAIKLTTRAYQIGGRLVGDAANEFVIRQTAGARINLTRHHAIGIEGTYAWRRADFADGMGTMAEADRTLDLRAFYAITTDEILGR